MAEFLIYAKTHWMDDLTPQEILRRVAENYKFQRKYNSRYQRGDVVEVRDNGYWLPNIRGFNRAAFVVIQITDMSLDEAQKYMKPWLRNVTIQQTATDTENHIYDYTVTLDRRRMDIDEELFDANLDRFRELPEDVSIVSRNTTQVVFRLKPLTHPAVIKGPLTPTERRDQVQRNGKTIIHEFHCQLRRRQFQIKVANLPQGVKDQLKSVGYAIFTKAQVATYLRNKVDG